MEVKTTASSDKPFFEVFYYGVFSPPCTRACLIPHLLLLHRPVRLLISITAYHKRPAGAGLSAYPAVLWAHSAESPLSHFHFLSLCPLHAPHLSADISRRAQDGRTAQGAVPHLQGLSLFSGSAPLVSAHYLDCTR